MPGTLSPACSKRAVCCRFAGSKFGKLVIIIDRLRQPTPVTGALSLCPSCIVCLDQTLLKPQGQYWIEYLYLLLAAPPYMAAANFVVITNEGGCALTGTADIDQ